MMVTVTCNCKSQAFFMEWENYSITHRSDNGNDMYHKYDEKEDAKRVFRAAERKYSPYDNILPKPLSRIETVHIYTPLHNTPIVLSSYKEYFQSFLNGTKQKLVRMEVDDLIEKVVPGTFCKFMSTVHKWYNEEDSSRHTKVWWLHGTKGSGKSTAAMILKEMFSPQVVASVFLSKSKCASIHQSNLVAFQMILSLANQLVTRFGDVYWKIVISSLKQFTDSPYVEAESRHLYAMLHGIGIHRDNITSPNRPDYTIGGDSLTASLEFTPPSSLNDLTVGERAPIDAYKYYEDTHILRKLTNVSTYDKCSESDAMEVSSPLNVDKRPDDNVFECGVIPNIEILAVHELFEMFIAIPLRRVPLSPNTSHLLDINGKYLLIVDGADSFDDRSSYSHVMAVVDMLVHHTPSWCTVVLTSNGCDVFRQLLNNVECHKACIDDMIRSSEVKRLLSHVLNSKQFVEHSTNDLTRVAAEIAKFSQDHKMSCKNEIYNFLTSHVPDPWTFEDIHECILSWDFYGYMLHMVFHHDQSEVRLLDRLYISTFYYYTLCSPSYYIS